MFLQHRQKLTWSARRRFCCISHCWCWHQWIESVWIRAAASYLTMMVSCPPAGFWTPVGFWTLELPQKGESQEQWIASLPQCTRLFIQVITGRLDGLWHHGEVFVILRMSSMGCVQPENFWADPHQIMRPSTSYGSCDSSVRWEDLSWGCRVWRVFNASISSYCRIVNVTVIICYNHHIKSSCNHHIIISSYHHITLIIQSS